MSNDIMTRLARVHDALPPSFSETREVIADAITAIEALEGRNDWLERAGANLQAIHSQHEIELRRNAETIEARDAEIARLTALKEQDAKQFQLRIAAELRADAAEAERDALKADIKAWVEEKNKQDGPDVAFRVPLTPLGVAEARLRARGEEK